jgi:Tol biopolymer transport system component
MCGWASRCGTGSASRFALLALLPAAVLVAGALASSSATGYTRVSLSSTGAQANDWSERASISADGRFVAFASAATNLVPGFPIPNSVLVRDMAARTTSRVSVTSSGVPIDRQQFFPAISANGRFVVFYTDASNVLPGDANRDSDVFVHDRATGATTAASVNSAGEMAVGPSGESLASVEPVVNADGRFVAFTSNAINFDAGIFRGIFVHDHVTGTTTRVSVSSAGDFNASGAGSPAISQDGRFVTFWCVCANLVPGDTNQQSDIFVRDRATATTTRVSVSSGGTEANGGSRLSAISADGRFVAFDSQASNLVPGDTNGAVDVFLRDRAAGTTTKISAPREGGSWPDISADGRFIAFTAFIARPYDPVFLHDRGTGETRIIAPGGGNPRLSGDGHFVAFATEWPLDPADTNDKADIYIHDRTVPLPPPPSIKVFRLTVAIKKGHGNILASGVLRPKIPGRVTVTLSRRQGGGFAQLRRRVVRLNAAGRYSVTFRRPRSGICKVRSHFLGGDAYTRPKDARLGFRC